MAPLSQFRCAVDGAEALGRLKDAPLPLGLTAGPPTRSFHRDVYLDTSDNALGSRGVICRLRIQTDDQRVLGLIKRLARVGWRRPMTGGLPMVLGLRRGGGSNSRASSRRRVIMQSRRRTAFSKSMAA